MNLYHVQDPDHGMFVFARSIPLALSRWQKYLADQCIDIEELGEPAQIALVCVDDEYILPDCDDEVWKKQVEEELLNRIADDDSKQAADFTKERGKLHMEICNNLQAIQSLKDDIGDMKDDFAKIHEITRGYAIDDDEEEEES